MVFTVYRTTNKTNGRYYIGVHKTLDPMDAYLGSGRLITRAIAKYGEGSFSKEVLSCCKSADEAFRIEFDLVAKHKNDPLCYNLRQGGSGGFDYINRVGLNGNAFITKEDVKKRIKTRRARFDSDPEYRQRIIEATRRIQKQQNPLVREQSRLKAVMAWNGNKHTKEMRRQFSETRTGKGNSHFDN